MDLAMIDTIVAFMFLSFLLFNFTPLTGRGILIQFFAYL